MSESIFPDALTFLPKLQITFSLNNVREAIDKESYTTHRIENEPISIIEKQEFLLFDFLIKLFILQFLINIFKIM